MSASLLSLHRETNKSSLFWRCVLPRPQWNVKNYFQFSFNTFYYFYFVVGHESSLSLSLSHTHTQEVTSSVIGEVVTPPLLLISARNHLRARTLTRPLTWPQVKLDSFSSAVLSFSTSLHIQCTKSPFVRVRSINSHFRSWSFVIMYVCLLPILCRHWLGSCSSSLPFWHISSHPCHK